MPNFHCLLNKIKLQLAVYSFKRMPSIKILYYRLKFVVGTSGVNLFISSDMFYLEIIVEASGGIKDVKIHHEGKVSVPKVIYFLQPVACCNVGYNNNRHLISSTRFVYSVGLVHG